MYLYNDNAINFKARHIATITRKIEKSTSKLPTYYDVIKLNYKEDKGAAKILLLKLNEYKKTLNTQQKKLSKFLKDFIECDSTDYQDYLLITKNGEQIVGGVNYYKRQAFSGLNIAAEPELAFTFNYADTKNNLFLGYLQALKNEKRDACPSFGTALSNLRKFIPFTNIKSEINKIIRTKKNIKFINQKEKKVSLTEMLNITMSDISKINPKMLEWLS